MLQRATLLLASACLANAAHLAPPSGPHPIEGEYIVSLHSNITTAAHDALVARFSAKKFSIGADFRAFHAKLSDEELNWVLAQDHSVALVEHNELMFIENNCPAQQSEPVSWGQVRTTTFAASDANQVFAHDPNWGAGVDAYILDTGVRCTHSEFAGGRCVWGANFAGGGNTDVNGHGTHCAGTVGGQIYGLAKSATIIAVKVLSDSGSGSIAGIIEGVQWSLARTQSTGRPGTVNLSLGGSFNQAYSNACRAATEAGLYVATSGGNNNRDSCLDSPNNEPSVLTVGSTELGNSGGSNIDNKSSFSNWGQCITLWAPGSSITSAGVSSDNAYSTLSGTSMACPHGVGAVAIKLTGGRSSTPATIYGELVADATPDIINGLNSQASPSPNLLLHVQC